ncbi:WYL domain-containing protein [Cohnella soli]|uniref:WYL domain-containing protein n=1 Tax=Cohnella soli TaxID=425005 RepID=A0ABW0HK98_9BACL
MNLFEKIFNYQIISRLDESGSFALTGQERTWLKMMLEPVESTQAFTPETLGKLDEILQTDDVTGIQGIIIEKAKSRERQVYHPLLRVLRRIIMRNLGIRLTYRMKHGGIKSNQHGFPYKLEYNVVKREWYLLWYNTRQHTLMSSKLQNIVAVEESELSAERVDALKELLGRLWEERKEHAVIQVVPTYNVELSRILYAFSCFEKSVSYDEDVDAYRIHISYLADESEFLLSKIRFLGLRVKIVKGEHLKGRMRESASRALARYGVQEEEAQ